MSELPHLRIVSAPTPIAYTFAGIGGAGVFATPVRVPSSHAKKLKSELLAAAGTFLTAVSKEPQESMPDGISITLRSDPNYELRLESLDRVRDGMELLSVRRVGDAMEANLFVAVDKVSN